MCCVSVDAARMGVIPVEEFKQHCINHHDSRDAGFEAEYEVCLQKYCSIIKTYVFLIWASKF